MENANLLKTVDVMMESVFRFCPICEEEIEMCKSNKLWENSNLMADHMENCYLVISGSKTGNIEMKDMVQLDYLVLGFKGRGKPKPT